MDEGASISRGESDQQSLSNFEPEDGLDDSPSDVADEVAGAAPMLEVGPADASEGDDPEGLVNAPLRPTNTNGHKNFSFRTSLPPVYPVISLPQSLNSQSYPEYP